jgi:hypothetical protein
MTAVWWPHNKQLKSNIVVVSSYSLKVYVMAQL